MKFTKLCLMFTAVTLAVGAFADAANVLVSFSTEADYYADGEKVLDGEWYALCWSPRETFGGITLDVKPVVEGDKILILAPLAEKGRCPETIFEVDSADVPKGNGNYFVYVLDTRDVDGNVAKSDDNGDVSVPSTTMNGAVAKTTGFTTSAVLGTKGRVKDTASVAVAGDVAWAPVQPKITGFEVCNNSTVKITVAGVMKGIQYDVSMGSSIKDMSCFKGAEFAAEDGKATFRVKSEDARFFQIVVSE